MSKKEELRRIVGNPTKELFAFILTRDLSLIDAINDLIDNCIDGARRLKPKGNYDGLFITIKFNKNSFSIDDNCGGIPIETARKYAFRFGRPKDMPETEYSVGQFGVGMKRAFFKIGKSFYVESKSSNSEFAIAVDIDDWLKQKDSNGDEDWSFEFNEDFKENIKIPEKKRGTKIEITPVRKEISNVLKTDYFADDLVKEVETKQMENIYNGINIKINGRKLKCKRPEFKVSSKIKIAEYETIIEKKIKLKILCGLGDPIYDLGGWYIFCNNRLLLGPEQTALTGWTGGGGGGVARYHHQYCEFRGIVYFEAENSFNLPWNTAKNDIDANASSFLIARGKMIEMMKPVIKLLNFAHSDRQSNPDGSEKQHKPYVDLIKKTKPIQLEDLKKSNFSKKFVVPDLKVKTPKEKLVTISYKKPKEVVDRVKKVMGKKSNADIGEATFDYYVDQEEIE